MIRSLRSGGLFGASVASLAIKCANVGLGVAITVVLARVLGAEGLGQYAFVYALVAVLAIPVQMGLPQLVVRETAKALQAAEPDHVRLVWGWAHLVVAGIAAVVVVGGALAVALFGAGSAEPEVLLWGLALVPLVGLGRLRGAALRGLGRVVLGQIPDSLLRPALFLLLVGAAVVLLPQALTPAQAMMLQVAAAAAAFLVGALLLLRHAPARGAAAGLRPPHRAWLLSAGILGAAEGMQVLNLNLDLLMLGLMRSEAEVGVYKVAVTAAWLVPFGLHAVAVATMTRVAQLVTAGDTVGLQRLVTAAARLILAAAVAAAAVLVLLGTEIFAVVFGAQYADAYAPLVILVLGHLAAAALGPVNMLLAMSGHERDALHGAGLACLANVVLNAALIPSFGMVGAAAATALTLLIWHLHLAIRVSGRLGIGSTFLGAVPRRAGQQPQ